MPESVYIHIPFCRQKCRYCSFVSFPDLKEKDKYIKTLTKKILPKYKGETLQTLYFGGGTPSLLSFEEISSIIKLFNLAPDAEVTVEINPETVTGKYLSDLKKTRVNRLSIGAQSFDNKILKIIGRKHKAEDVLRVVKDAKKAGFDNISLDFIYGLPQQTLNGFIKDLELAAKLDVEHISLYGLKIDEGCYFYKNKPENIADEDLQADMYLKAVEVLEKQSFQHYEISNFARNKKFSRHNINYWQCGEYYGFGVSAHGYIDGIRYSNTKNLQDYLTKPEPQIEQHKLSKQEQLEEKIFLGLRLSQGININDINREFEINFEDKYYGILKKYTATGHLKFEKGLLKLTKKGILISNYILADFLE